MITLHFFFDVWGAGTGARLLFASLRGVGAVFAWARGKGEATALSGAISRGACVTLPSIASPPSLTDPCCTVTFCSPPVR
jgi:hypothetical protein